MKMVSAAKLRRAQEAMIAARPYARRMLRRCWPAWPRRGASRTSHPLLAERTGNARPAGRDRHRRQGSGRRLQLQPDPRRACGSSRERAGRELAVDVVGPQGPRLLPAPPVHDPHRARRALPGRCATPVAQAIAQDADPSSSPQRRDRRGLPRLQRVQERHPAEAHGRAAAARSSGRPRTQTEPAIDYIYEPRPPSILARCCRATSRSRSTGRCSSRRPPSTARA